MKGLFVYFDNINYGNLSGVEKKVLSQIRAFDAAGMECRLLPMPGILAKSKTERLFNALMKRLPYTNLEPNFHYSDEFEEADFIYFRKPSFLSVHLRRLLKKIKSRNPNIRVIMEIPTYPYDAEYKPLSKNLPFLLKDRHNRNRLIGLIDRIAVVSDLYSSELFSIDAIRITNGIDLSTVPIRAPRFDGTIDICCVAQFARWHGYDRLLLGLINYYRDGGKRDIVIHMVGEGDELSKYKRIASDSHIAERVFFYGFLSGKRLDEIYDIADIGVTSLGCYRKAIFLSSELKSREYLAKGLPMVAGCPIDTVSEKNCRYFCEFQNDDTPININHVVSFFDMLYDNGESSEQVAKSIRAFAEKTVDIRTTMKPIVDYLNDGSSESGFDHSPVVF